MTPRFNGCPPICNAANLPMFENEQAWAHFEQANTPGTKVILKFKCKACHHLHYWASNCDPAGGSSGTTRTASHFETILRQAKAKFKALIAE